MPRAGSPGAPVSDAGIASPDDRVGPQRLLGAAGRAAQGRDGKHDANDASLHPNTAAVMSAYQAAASFASALRVSAGALTGLTTMPGSDSWYWPSTTR